MANDGTGGAPTAIVGPKAPQYSAPAGPGLPKPASPLANTGNAASKVGLSGAASPLAQRLGRPMLSPQQAAQGVYYGYTTGFSGGVMTQTPVIVPEQNARSGYLSLSASDQQRLTRIMNVKYPNGWDPSWIKNVWKEGVNGSMAYATSGPTGGGPGVTPLEVLESAYLSGAGAPGMGGGKGGGGGGFGGTTTQRSVSYNLTDPDTAAALADTMLSQYLGHEAGPKASAEFRKALAAHEQKNPTVTNSVQTVTGSARASNVSSTSRTTGGSNAQAFAKAWAQGQEGSSEYAAATTMLDAFMGALENRSDVVA